ncbi:hypothetical protein VSX64_16965 [Aurantimonas sp. C2-6-R+9]|uniref:hypothetical protein n=1 Tax=unclassified Aurantimonas TaxID=2638230 RepID=UPI002E1735B4|nr:MULTISPECIES: hypothetical protein [unclassified Aurantimonas]MEC5292386.1 hypothetical protein [Aurantimonas sp. C2-3-R2]MEC5382539.1 hypothetical protein [Aurantimonas sp. C2-6-R+9]MEC5413445.1 hypothetical protein [Aurantimonas sp. C2-4-R8]
MNGQSRAQVGERREEESAQREIEDLAAQQGMNAATQAMNDATQRMADYAWWSTLLVGIGTVLLVATLLLTLAANRAAVRAADAAFKANDLMKVIAQHQLRAYLAPDNMSHARRVDGRHVDYILKLKNFGQTPAKQVTLKVRTGLSAGDDEDVDWGEFVERPSVDLPPSQFLGVEIEVWGINETNISEKVRCIMERRSKLHAHAIFSYIDIYGIKRAAGFYASTWGDTFRHGGIGIDVYETEKEDGQRS